jgi:hypothetical protein
MRFFMSKLIRVSDESYSKLKSIVKTTGASQQDIIDAALKNWERDLILKQANEAYMMLRKNDKEWAEEQEELQAWDATLNDGLEDE